jgi:long-subunit fatty acid transport protein
MRKLSAIGLTSLGLATFATPAIAGGYDTPILFSAEHMGFGGAAIGFVDDPSAMFHNPAGLMGTEGLSLMLNLTLITGGITSSPGNSNPNEESEPLLALAPLVGASYKLNDIVAFGLAFYPVASAGAEYLYNEGGADGLPVRNFTSVRFLEISPGVAFSIPGTGLSLGAGYRISMVSLGRYLGPAESDSGSSATFDVEMSGVNLTGFRLGAQWKYTDLLELGVVFRSKSETTISADAGTVLLPATNIETEFTLPAKLGFGARVNLDPVSIVADLEYGFYSQNQRNAFTADPALPLPIVNVSKWRDAITFRTGLEYNLDDYLFFRGGFLFDGQVSRQQYPSAFGTPPDSTMGFTAGLGLELHDWELNLAVSHRFGSTKVEKGSPAETCIPCSFDGDYSLSMTGFYLDFTWNFPDL